MLARVLAVLVMSLCSCLPMCFGFSRPCFSPQQAGEHAGKDICIAAHVYGVEQAADGTRLLDVCGPADGAAAESAVKEAADPPKEVSRCSLLIVSLAQDRREVGSLQEVAQKDVQLRGTIHNMHGQSILLLSSSRQFHDGPEKFRPNPELLRGFSADEAATAFRDPEMSSHGKHSGSSAFAGKLTPVH